MNRRWIVIGIIGMLIGLGMNVVRYGYIAGQAEQQLEEAQAALQRCGCKELP